MCAYFVISSSYFRFDVMFRVNARLGKSNVYEFQTDLFNFFC